MRKIKSTNQNKRTKKRQKAKKNNRKFLRHDLHASKWLILKL